MKTLHENQNMSMSLKAAPATMKENHRPRIGDDDGISDRTMNALIVLFTVFTIVISIGSSIGQEAVKYRILLRQAMLDMDRLEYDKALTKLLEVHANTGDNANVNHMVGLCYLRGEGAAEKAAFYLSQAVQFVSHTHQEWDLDEMNAPPESMYHLALAYEQMEDYAKAAEYYGEFLSGMQTPGKPNTSRTFAIISSKAEQCKLAAAAQQQSQETINVAVNR